MAASSRVPVDARRDDGADLSRGRDVPVTSPDLEIAFELEKPDADGFDTERRRVLKAASNARFVLLTGLYLAMGIGMLAIGLASLAMRRGGFIGWQLTIEGFAFVCFAATWYVVYVRSIIGRRQIGRRTTVALFETGVLVAGDGLSPMRYSWHCIARVSQSVAGVVIAPRGALRAVYVPARAMADGGDALYAYVAERIVSRRMLIARPEAFGPSLPRSVDGTVPAPLRPACVRRAASRARGA